MMKSTSKTAPASPASGNTSQVLHGEENGGSLRVHELLDEVLELRRQRENLVNLARICAIVNSNLDLGTLLRLAMGVAKEVVQAEAASLLLRDDATGDLMFQVAEGIVSDSLQQIHRVPRGVGIAGWVAEHGEKLLLSDVYTDPRFCPEFDRMTGFRCISMIAVPLRVKGRIIGVAQAINKWDDSDGARRTVEFSESDLELFSLFCDQVAVAIDNARLHLASLEQQRLEMDLTVARDIQRSFLPTRFPPLKGYTFSAQNEPALWIGGDLYDVFPLTEGRMGIALGDVCGKGISAALYMARVLSELRVAAIEESRPAGVLASLNRRLRERNTQGMFVTLFFAALDPLRHRMDYSLAGHHEPVLLRSGEPPLLLPHTGGIPLGLDANRSFDQAQISIEPGETVLAYTDGVVEAIDASGSFFGKQELINLLKSLPESEQNPHDMIRITLDAVRRHVGFSPIRDDVTMLAMKRGE